MPFDPQFLWSGIVVGSMYAVGALGLTLAWGVLNFLNVAYGEFVSLSALLMVSVATIQESFAFAIVAGVVLAAIGFALLDRVLFVKFRTRGSFTLLFVSVGAMFILRNVMYMVWGPEPRVARLGIAEGYRALDVLILPKEIITLVVSIVTMMLVYAILKRTRMGIAMRAAAEDMDLSKIRGIDTERVVLYVALIAGAMAAITGVLVGVNFHVAPRMGFTVLIPIVAAAVLGGVGDPRGAVVGGLIIGLAQEMSVAVIPPAYKIAVGMIIFMIVILVKPEGIFGGLIEE